VRLLHGTASLGRRGAGIGGIAVDMSEDCIGQKEKIKKLLGSRWLQYNRNDSVSIQGDVSWIYFLRNTHFEKWGFQDVSS
jgi:hypothetical protein